MIVLAFSGLAVIAMLAYGIYLMRPGTNPWEDERIPDLYKGAKTVSCEGGCGAKLAIWPHTARPFMCAKCFDDKAYLRG